MNIFKYAVFATALSLSFSSCSEDELGQEIENSQYVKVGNLTFQIGDYPSGALRAINLGEYKEGDANVPGFSALDDKTSWSAGEVVNVILTCRNIQDGSENKYDVTLRYTGEGWSVSGTPLLDVSAANTLVDVSAAYISPNPNNVVLNKSEDGKTYEPVLSGFSEYFQYDKTDLPATEPIKIVFKREYCRIRVNVPEDIETVNVLFGEGFYANGLTSLAGSTYTVGENNDITRKGNFYIYATWEGGSVLTLNDRKFQFKPSLGNQTYAIDLAPVEPSFVEVNPETHTINVLEGGEITEDNIAYALGSSTELNIAGYLDEASLEFVLNYLNEQEVTFTLDLSQTNLSSLSEDAVIKLKQISQIKFPATLQYIASSPIEVLNAVEIFLPAASIEFDEDEEPFATGKKYKKNALNSTLHLNASYEEEYGEETEWGGLEWGELLFDAE